MKNDLAIKFYDFVFTKRRGTKINNFHDGKYSYRNCAVGLFAQTVFGFKPDMCREATGDEFIPFCNLLHELQKQFPRIVWYGIGQGCYATYGELQEDILEYTSYTRGGKQHESN